MVSLSFGPLRFILTLPIKVWNKYRIFTSANIRFGNIHTSMNIGSGREEYSQIFVGGYIAAQDPIYALYVDCTSNISSSGRISVMYSSMLGLPMMYITHISSKSSVFETIRVNKSMNTCPILASIKYLRVFILVLSANIREYS